MDVTWADHRWKLLAERAVAWPAQATLIVADVHFGKAEHFRQAGVPVPGAVLERDLHRLDQLIAETRADRLLVLGDLFHAPTGMSPALLDRLIDWRTTHDTLHLVMVRGNHDRHCGEPPPDLRIEDAGDALHEAGLIFRHEPTEQRSDRPVMAGHLHPAVWLHGYGRASERLACFWLTPRQAVLPAFGSFTGMKAIRPRAGDRVCVVGEGQVVDVTPGGPKASA